jgi:hypothetical protein
MPDIACPILPVQGVMHDLAVVLKDLAVLLLDLAVLL